MKTTTVIFDISKPNGEALKIGSILTIAPTGSNLRVDSPTIITNDKIVMQAQDNSGEYIMSLYPQTYSCTVFDKSQKPPFYISVPYTTESLYASDLLVSTISSSTEPTLYTGSILTTINRPSLYLYLADSSGSLSKKDIVLTPLSRSISLNQSKIITNDRILTQTDNNGYATFTSIIPGIYTVRLNDDTGTILVPDTNNNYNVADLFVTVANTGSYFISNAISASHAINADNSISSSHSINSDNAISASYALSSSYALTYGNNHNGNLYVTSSQIVLGNPNTDNQLTISYNSQLVNTIPILINDSGYSNPSIRLQNALGYVIDFGMEDVAAAYIKSTAGVTRIQDTNGNYADFYAKKIYADLIGTSSVASSSISSSYALKSISSSWAPTPTLVSQSIISDSSSMLYGKTLNVYTSDLTTFNFASINYSIGNYVNDGSCREILVYSYKIIDGARVYSTNSISSGVVCSSGNPLDGTVFQYYYEWAAAADADGYRAVYDDGLQPRYRDITTNFFYDNELTEWTDVATVVLTPNTYFTIFSAIHVTSDIILDRPLTSSYLLNATCSYALTATDVDLNTGSTYPITSSWAITSSNALTIPQNINITSITASTISSSIIYANTPTLTNEVATKGYVDTLNPFGLDFYFRSSSADVAGYKDMKRLDTQISAAATTFTTNAASASQYVFQFISPAIGITNIAQGSINIHSHIYRTGGAASNTIIPEIYVRSASVETEIAVGDARLLITDTNNFDTDTLILTSSYATNTTDRLVVKFKMGNATGTPNVSCVVEDGTAAGITIPTPSSNFVLKSGDTLTGLLVGTCSYANNSLSASYVPVAALSTYTTLLTSSLNYITMSFNNSDAVVNLTLGQLYSFTQSDMPVTNTMVSDTTLYINNTATATSSLSFPASWKSLSGGWPTQLTASKNALVWLRAYGTASVIGGVNLEL